MTLFLICGSELTVSVKSVGHIAAVAVVMVRLSSPSSLSEMVMVMSDVGRGVQHVRVGISRLIRRLITLLIHRRRHYSLVVQLLLLLVVVIVAVRQIEADAEIRVSDRSRIFTWRIHSWGASRYDVNIRGGKGGQ